jgi:hypothetical protein
MAREITVSLWCDPCLAQDIRTVGEETPPIPIGAAKPRILCLCKEHWEVYEQFADLLKEHGQVVDHLNPAPKRTSPGSGGRRTHTDYGPFPEGKWECPVPDCGSHNAKSLKEKSSVHGHMRKQHGVTLGEYLREHADEPEAPAATNDMPMRNISNDVKVWCPHPDCADRAKPFKNKSSLGVHFNNGARSAHGVPMGEWFRQHPEIDPEVALLRQ